MKTNQFWTRSHLMKANPFWTWSQLMKANQFWTQSHLMKANQFWGPLPQVNAHNILQRNYKLKTRDNTDSLFLFLLDFPNLPFSPSLAACERLTCTGRFWSTAQSAPEPGWWTSCSWRSWGDHERSPGWPDDLQPAQSGGAHSSGCSDQPD